MFRTKICGVTRPTDARAIAAAGADAMGLNFYPRSPRYVTTEQAAQVTAALPDDRVLRVGVFVNESVDAILRSVEAARLSAVQLHGDESPEIVAALKLVPVIRAFRLKKNGSEEILEFIRACQSRHPLAAILVDASVPGQFGGTGVQADWNEVVRLATGLRDPKLSQCGRNRPGLILAGGLTPDNIDQAIEQTRPDGVDTASGVEDAPGIKNAQAVARFVKRAHAAFAR